MRRLDWRSDPPIVGHPRRQSEDLVARVLRRVALVKQRRAGQRTPHGFGRPLGSTQDRRRAAVGHDAQSSPAVLPPIGLPASCLRSRQDAARSPDQCPVAEGPSRRAAPSPSAFARRIAWFSTWRRVFGLGFIGRQDPTENRLAQVVQPVEERLVLLLPGGSLAQTLRLAIPRIPSVKKTMAVFLTSMIVPCPA